MRSLVLIHGSGTLGSEIVDLKNIIDSEGNDIAVHTVPVDLVPIIGVLYWAKRRGVRDGMAEQITSIIRKVASIDRTTIVAHSYASYLLAWWLNEQRLAKLRNIVLLAPIVRRDEIAALTHIADRVVIDVVISDKIPCVAEAIRPDQYEATGSFGLRGQGAVGRGSLTTRFFAQTPHGLSGSEYLRSFPRLLFCGSGHSFHLNIDHFKENILPIVISETVPKGSITTPSLTQATVHWIRMAALGFAVFVIFIWAVWSIYPALAAILLVAVIIWRSGA